MPNETFMKNIFSVLVVVALTFSTQSLFAQSTEQKQEFAKRQRKLDLEEFLSNKTCQFVAYAENSEAPEILTLKQSVSIFRYSSILINERTHYSTHLIETNWFGPKVSISFNVLIEPAVSSDNYSKEVIADVSVSIQKVGHGFDTDPIGEPSLVKFEDVDLSVAHPSFSYGNYSYVLYCFVNL